MPSAEAERALSVHAANIRDLLVAWKFAEVAKQAAKRICLRPSKGAHCHWLTRKQLADCPKSKERFGWDIDSGEDPRPMTCAEAFQKSFLSSPRLMSARVGYNCFPERPDNNPGTVYSVEFASDVYVEYYDPGDDEGGGWLSLWLHFAKRGSRYVLTGITSQYWGI
jgi:hypothetical protein